MTAKIPCPFVYANGKKCAGHVVRVEAYKADIEWAVDADGKWVFSVDAPRSHYHVFCSAKDNHAGVSGPDNDQMKFYLDELPDALTVAMAEAERHHKACE